MRKLARRFVLQLGAVLVVAALVLPLTATAQNAVTFLRTDEPGTGDLTKAAIVGRILLKTQPATVTDDQIIGNDGQGGQGLLPIPVVYNGWVQNLPEGFKSQLTPSQLNSPRSTEGRQKTHRGRL